MVFLSVHLMFDFLAVALAILAGFLVIRFRLLPDVETTASCLDPRYFLFLTLGSVLGAYGFGTLNLILSDVAGVGRSILGSLFGATFAVEVYKLLFRKHVGRSTGYIYVVPFCVLVAVGRIGCLLSGLGDNTYGIPTGAAWGWNFGDGILRHPVALYESISMSLCGIGMVVLLHVKPRLYVLYAYYICVGFYATQRFVWEFLKPYHAAFGGVNVFHILCLVLCIYSVVTIVKVRRYDRSPA